jgi:hypothetical protein
MLHHHKKSKKNNQKLANNIEKTDPSAFYDLLNGPSLAGSFEHYCRGPNYRRIINQNN